MRRQRIFKAFMLAVAALAIGCGHDAPVHLAAEKFVVLSEDRAPDGSAITINIRVGSQAAESEVKAAAEAAIMKYRSSYTKVTVKSFRRDNVTNEIPFAVTSLEGGQVRHSFNSTGPQKIPTH